MGSCPTLKRINLLVISSCFLSHPARAHLVCPFADGRGVGDCELPRVARLTRLAQGRGHFSFVAARKFLGSPKIRCDVNYLAVRRAITKSTWAEIRTAYASGIGLREIARNMDIPVGTILSRAKREGWSRHRDNAKALAKREETAKTITPFEAASASMQQRGERHLGRMANIVEKTMPHVEAMEPGAILDPVDDVEKLDKVARRTFGISDDASHGENVIVNIGILG